MDTPIRKSLPKSFFERELESYGDVVPDPGQKSSDLVLSLQGIDLPSAARVLDISTGTGFVVKQVLNIFPDSRVVGMDFSDKILCVASRRLTGASFQVADAELLPFRENAFSLAVCRYSFHHFPQVLDHLHEVRRVLEPDGTYLIMDPVPFEGAFDREINRVFTASEAKVSGHVRFYTEREYRTLLSQAGFALAAARRYTVRIRWSLTIHGPLIGPLLTMTEPARSQCDLQWNGKTLSLHLPAMALHARKA